MRKMLGAGAIVLLMLGCKNGKVKQAETTDLKIESQELCCGIPGRGSGLLTNGEIGLQEDSLEKHSWEGMVLIPGGEFNMGARDKKFARKDEYPVHRVHVNAFYMDEHEVTNAQFRQFVEATGYITFAERKLKWEDVRKTLPPGTPKPPDAYFESGSLVFNQPDHPVPLNNHLVWWKWQKGANWQQPTGPGSTIKGKENHPVVHVVYEDALAYANWAGKRLPTEAEWEYAARGGNDENIYPWGTELVDVGAIKANSWQGNFPNQNTKADGYMFSSPVKQYAANAFGLFDMAGNVWELCSDWYHHAYYASFNGGGVAINPPGPDSSLDPAEPQVQKKVIRGGSFLCNDAYCSGYRAAARMKMALDSSAPHVGFRCVRSIDN